MIPAWILDIFAAVMLVVAAVSAARLVAARPWRPGAVVLDTDVAHLLMAIAMAGMLVGSLRTLPDGAWEVVFGVLTAWFGYRVVRDARASGVRALAGGHCAPHLVHSAAMLYMFLALAAPAAGGADGRHGRVRDADPGLSHPGVRVRARAGGLQRVGSRPALRQPRTPAPCRPPPWRLCRSWPGPNPAPGHSLVSPLAAAWTAARRPRQRSRSPLTKARMLPARSCFPRE